MTIVMGLDQHRAQITADWVDTMTGETSRARVTPADRVDVRAFLARFAGQELEVGLEATTGWRFVVEELTPSATAGDWPPSRRILRPRSAVSRSRRSMCAPTERSSGLSPTRCARTDL